MSRIEEKVIAKIKARAKFGENKYKTTMERTDLSTFEWLKHAQEEAMDLAVYIEKIQESLREDYEELLLDMFAEKDEVIMSDFSSDPWHDPYEDARRDKESLGYAPCSAHALETERVEEERERRMDIIGRNGNTGEHYDEANYMYDKASWRNKDAIQKSQQRSVYPGDAYVTTTTYETKKENIQPGWNED